MVVEVQDENHTSAKIDTSEEVVDSIPKAFGKVEEEIKIQVCHGFYSYYIKNHVSIIIGSRILYVILTWLLFYYCKQDLPLTEDDEVKEKIND